MAVQDVSEARRPVDRSDRGGSISMVLVVALLLVGSVVAFLFVGRSNAQPYVLALLSALAVIGVFALFAGAAGIMRLVGQGARATGLLRHARQQRGRRPRGHGSGRPRGLRQSGLPRAVRGGRCRRRTPGGARVRRRSAGLRTDLSARQGGARRPQARGRGAGAGRRRCAGALAAPARAPARKVGSTRAGPPGRSAT